MYFRRSPHQSLAAHVDYYWYASDAPRPERVHVVPSGTLEIVFNLRDNEFRISDPSDPAKFVCHSGAVVSGAQARYFAIEVPAHASTIGVHFRPGGAFALLGVPPGALTDEHANLDAVWGVRATEIHERLCSARNLEARFRILDRALTERLATQPRDEVMFALARLLRTNARVDRVASEVDLSHRRFIEVFSAEVGVGPKIFSRVGRFQRALALAQREPSPQWSELALQCGYSDQPHLIREFVSLAGLAPRDLLERSAAVEGHHAALAAERG
jgi:AraC-like DNA-binding protein